MTCREVNFDALVGPTHNYAGLARGNLASARHRHQVSNPKAAALQGLLKMKLLMDLGLTQGVLPPHERPDILRLRKLGFGGSDVQVLRGAVRDAPELLAACASASSMWAANAATVSPSADTADGRVHLTAANLVQHLHRSIEAETTAAFLEVIFPDASMFAHHRPLVPSVELGDEGAANHMRLCQHYGEGGLEVFVFGPNPKRFPARQKALASQTIARLHQLDSDRTVFVEQNPDAVDAGVFHNDVISVANQHVLLYHRQAFAGGAQVVEEIRRKFARCGGQLEPIEVCDTELPLREAVKTYLFNSQLIALHEPDAGMALVCPTDCERSAAARSTIDRILAQDNPIKQVHYVDTRQSMRNGGGPACLRLRVVLTDGELSAIHQGVLLDETRFQQLVGWVERHYRDRLAPADLSDPKLLDESRSALDDLSQLLGLGSIYPFQRG